jgi:hypothetical protein
MERLELVVSHGRSYDGWQCRGVVDPAQEPFNSGPELVAGRRWNEASLAEAAAPGSNDHDAVAKSAGVTELTDGASNKSALEIPEHPDRHWAIFRPRECEFGHPLEIQNLADLGRHVPLVVPICRQDIGERGIGPLQRARALGLTA